ncbi:MAG: hypothetical protein MK199_01765, partial [Acidimicrobiales bacterium]|nr:hypothetical protein [Acidimicrobiales bacterium]
PSVVLQVKGYPRPRVQYMQHPREPSSTLGLGPFAESYVFGAGRYLHLGDATSGPRTMTNPARSAQ